SGCVISIMFSGKNRLFIATWLDFRCVICDYCAPMNKTYLNSQMLVVLASFLFFLIPQFQPAAYAQQLQPYSYQFYQKLNRVQYSWESRQHTAVKPMILDSLTARVHDSLMRVGFQERNTWAGRKIWNEHLIEVEADDFYFYADFLPDFQIGRDFASGGETT